MMRIFCLLLLAIVQCTSFMVLSYAGEDDDVDILTHLAGLHGKKYVEARDKVLGDETKMMRLLIKKSLPESLLSVKIILLGWKSHGTVYKQMLSGFERYEHIARNAIIPYEPRPELFAKEWSKVYGKLLVPLMLECLWKHPEWKSWRKPATTLS